MVWVAVWGAPLALWLRAACPGHTARAALLYGAGLLGGGALVAAASGLGVGVPADVLGAGLGWWLGGPALRRVQAGLNLYPTAA